nr:GNAT family N-acetyltransferase [uncultured Sphingomonas sp.]
MVEIRTERLLLRRATMDDLDSFHTIMSDPRAMRYWSCPPHQNKAQTQLWLQSMVEGATATSDDFVMVMDGRAIGKMGAYQLPDFGFLLAPQHWGKGLASEALAAFIAHRRGIDPDGRLTADVDPRNAASLNLLRRHGFTETGRATATWQVGDELCDSIYLALALSD